MYPSRYSSPSSHSSLFLIIITFVVLAAGALVVVAAGRLPAFVEQGTSQAVTTFGIMLASLAGVVLSVILPDRLGKAILLLGAAGFFAGLGYALATGVRF